MKIDQGMIQEINYEYPGIHLIHLKDGRIIGIDDDFICLYKDMDQFYFSTEEIPTINLKEMA